MANGDPRNWRSWIAPGIILTAIGLLFVVVSWQLSGIGYRIGAIEGREGVVAADIREVGAKVDRRVESVEARVSETNARIDRVLEGQTSAAERLAQLQSDVTYVRDRVDQIAERLEAAAAPSRSSPAMVSVTEALDALKAAGLEFYDIRQLQETTSPALQQGVVDGDILILTQDNEITRQLRDAGIEPLDSSQVEMNQSNGDLPESLFAPQSDQQ